MNSSKEQEIVSGNEKCIDVCNSLLRGELSAIETYGQAIHKYDASPVAGELRRIRSEHTESASRLSANVRDMGGEPEKNSGTWGLFTAAVQGAANLFGAESAMESLQRGEEMGRTDYQHALLSDDVMPACKEMIREELLPRIMNHIAVLENLEKSVSQTPS